MQLSRFRNFASELKRSEEITSIARSIKIYRTYLGNWFDEDDEAITDPELIKRLQSSLRKGSYWREGKSCDAFFPLLGFSSIVIISFNSPSRGRTLDKMNKSLEKCLEHSNDSFDASHDSLTGLLNVASFEKELFSLFSKGIQSKKTVGDAISEMRTITGIAIIMLDLDYFKQVNDSYGHDYGDIVLMCFARRLEYELEKLQREEDDVFEVHFGRSSGEEFVVAIYGKNVMNVMKIAERLRYAIDNEILPTDQEWAAIPKERKPEGMAPPHASERRIACSIGISNVVSPGVDDDLRRVAVDLRREADTALMRAKSGGRNVVRYFPEIRNRYGAVLKHHAETDVVIIDIGTNVDVSAGDEFLVYHPDFTGEKAFIFSDGRTVKRLGCYPRKSCGRLLVFEAQKEISFCRVLKKEGTSVFPEGSLLEFVPLGSISHLISQDRVVHGLEVQVLSKPENIQKTIEDMVSKEADPVVIIFSLDNFEELERSRGTAFVNHSLVALYKTIKEKVSEISDISQIEPNRLAVVFILREAGGVHGLINEVISSASNRCDNLAQFAAGIFLKQEKIKGDNSSLDPKRALEYAKYALRKEARMEGKIAFFSAMVAARVVGQLRSQGKYKDGLSEYLYLKAIGVDYGYMENQGALCATEVENPDHELALKCIKRAFEMIPDDPLLIANYAAIEFNAGNPKRAHELFLEVEHVKPGYSLDGVYLGTKALAAYNVYRETPELVDLSELGSLLEKARTAIQPINPGYEVTDIEEALSFIAGKINESEQTSE